MEAELAAAREAQKMLLPAAPPEAPGLAVAAVCRAARDSSGDFFDFYPRPDGKLCIVVAAGGTNGLASAMTMALAKGFLIQENAAETPAAEALLQLERELGGVLRRTSDSIRFGVAVIAERPEMFGRTLIYLGLAEGIAIYGLVMSILLLGRI